MKTGVYDGNEFVVMKGKEFFHSFMAVNELLEMLGEEFYDIYDRDIVLSVTPEGEQRVSVQRK